MKIGKFEILPPVTLAPMAGFGDVAFRRLCRDYGAALTTTEMVSVKGLCYNNQNTGALLTLAPNESPSCVQLFGGEPEFFVKALSLPALKNFDILDVNMGCPMPKVTKNGEGSALMKDVSRAAKVAEACVKFGGGRPVTVKFRLGWDCNSLNAVEFARVMQNSGVSAMTVHGRTTEQMYRGKADWNKIADVAAAVNVPVLGNGDVTSATECARRLRESGCAGIAVGRGALGHPEIFSEVLGEGHDSLKKVVLKHLDYMLQYFPEKVAVHEMRKHLVHYLKGVPNAKPLRAACNNTESADLLKLLLCEAL